MLASRPPLWALLGLSTLACRGGAPLGPAPPPGDQALFVDITQSNLPIAALTGLSMDAHPADVDADGDLDLVVASEFAPNILLLNDGNGLFIDVSPTNLPSTGRDSEDVGMGDFDADGDIDIVIVSEDDQVNELYLNDGMGRFTNESARLPVTGVSNAVVVADLTGDGLPDVVIGNNGQNTFLVNLGQAQFADETSTRLPALADITQDVELGDADGDGDLDLLVGNEDANRLLFNAGNGVFTDESAARIPLRSSPEETREADFGDVDGDGDLDIFFANVTAFVVGADPANRLLINTGQGFFDDESETRLPTNTDRSFDGDFIDVDRDGDLDIVTSNADVFGGLQLPFRVFSNDGRGFFTDSTTAIFPPTAIGFGFDVEAADFTGNGFLDLYLASRGGTDRLLVHRN